MRNKILYFLYIKFNKILIVQHLSKLFSLVIATHLDLTVLIFLGTSDHSTKESGKECREHFKGVRDLIKSKTKVYKNRKMKLTPNSIKLKSELVYKAKNKDYRCKVKIERAV